MSEEKITDMVWQGHRVVEWYYAPAGGMLRWALCAGSKAALNASPGQLDLPIVAEVTIGGEVTCLYCKDMKNTPRPAEKTMADEYNDPDRQYGHMPAGSEM